MKNTIEFPANPLLAAILDKSGLTAQVKRAAGIAQWGGLVSHRLEQQLQLAVCPKDTAEAVDAGRGITGALESLSGNKEASALFLAETEPLYQRLLAWHRWNRFHLTPWLPLFERSSGVDPQCLEAYSREGYILSLAFGTESQAAAHLRGYLLAKKLHNEEISEEDARSRVYRAARSNQQVYKRLEHRRQKRTVLAWGNDPIEEYHFIRSIAAYMNLIDLESLLA